jgi:hypothetical protein
MRVFVKSALALAVAVMAGSATAGVLSTFNIQFEGVAGQNFSGGESFAEAGVKLSAFDPFGGGFVGAGSNSGTCDINVCPSSNSAFYAVLNDGALTLETSSGLNLMLSGFNAGFIAPVFDLAFTGTVGQIIVTGHTGGGQKVASFDLPGLLENGTSSFAGYSFDQDFASTEFSSVTFNACLFDGNGGCTSYANFNLAQFGLDGITGSVIPEPSSYALMALALGAAGFAGRRRRNA